MPRLPSWACAISAMTKHGWPGPTGRCPMTTVCSVIVLGLPAGEGVLDLLLDPRVRLGEPVVQRVTGLPPEGFDPGVAEVPGLHADGPVDVLDLHLLSRHPDDGVDQLGDR